MEELETSFLEGRSLRHANGRELRVSVYHLWDYWPACNFPERRPPFPEEFINAIASFASLHRGLLVQLPDPNCIPELQWSYCNWSQLEICTRHLALLLDDFLITTALGVDTIFVLVSDLSLLNIVRHCLTTFLR